MAAVSVFVDDAILGRLPMVCMKTGRPADLVVRSTRRVGGLSPALWLLLLLGPVGVVALVVISLAGAAGEELTVRVPYSQAAWEEQRRGRKGYWSTIAAGAGALLAALLLQGLFPLMWLLVGVVLVVTGLTKWALSSSRRIDISLDASRRWVTFSGVHPAFVDAVMAERQEATAGR